MRLADLAPVIVATWPPARTTRVGAFTVPGRDGGGSRVSALRLTDPGATDASDADVDAALSAQAATGQAPLAMVLDHQTALDENLAMRGLVIRDETLGLVADCADFAAPPPPVSCFPTWPPLAIQEEIWAAGGIGPARLAVMDRATGPKISLFGRVNDKPAGTAFVAIHNGIAMLHALEIALEQRRRGLAQIMMRSAGQWALDQGATRFSVLVTRENKPAQALYASLGFQPVGQYHYRTGPT